MIWHRGYFIFFFFMALLGCKKSHHVVQTHNDTEINSKASQDWLKYVDSTKVLRPNSQVVDSLMFCFMNDEAPSVISKTHMLFWKNGKIINNNKCLEEVDGYFEISTGHYVIYLIRSKSIYINELTINKSIECINDKYFDFTKIPCLEVYSLEKDTIKENLVYLKATMSDICFNTLSDTILTFSINR